MLIHLKLPDLFKFLRGFNGKSSLKTEDMCQFWNHINNNGTEVERHRAKYTLVASYQCSSRLLMQNLDNVGGGLIYCQGCAEIDV